MKKKNKKYDFIKKYLLNIPKINEYEIYKGKIVNIIDNNVIFDFGYKKEGIVPLNEFKKKKIKIGEKKDILVEKLNYKGNCLLSYKKAKKFKLWIKIKTSYLNKEILKGTIINRTKGGFVLILFKKIICFLPGSQTNLKIIKNYDLYIGKKIDVQILKINLKNQNIIVSHKILIEKKIKNKKKYILSKLEIGQIIKGKIKNILSYGAFIDLGGLDGLLHITDITWEKIQNPFEKLKIGKTYNFIILGIDKDKFRVQLGLKQLTNNPWDLLIKKIKVGSVIKNGIVTAITDYGAFIDIGNGIEGLLHVSEMSWENDDLKLAKNFVKINQKIKCIIISIDEDDKKIYLSIKKLQKDPWEEKIKKFSIGSKHTGIIYKILKKNYGLKIELEKNVFGILLNKEISWYYLIENLYIKYKVGEKIEVVILSIDYKNRKIFLGHKQLTSNNWDIYKKEFEVNTIHKGKIIKILNNGLIVQNEKKNFLNFFMPNKFLNNKKYKIDDLIKFKVLKINEENKQIIIKPYNIKNESKSTFGDLFELNLIKKIIEKKEKKKN
ncbi:MAG: S1 RNA-binding domain-containing protein [Candidatus Shikimatogenerans sp. JK-2022]|nr:S1 RNA-binding domain-containing protein [Candidatus Shikimatogenerans bostrichidophilus]